ncbi:helix-hairpin-helix domain-containing protein [Streptomyces sp. ODS05-4]|uniref:helix-hairpin-helix domain-containing protein n=1 Tax=Streptomyces sp. ODS05-4 TaxID=2944939 RepID=UPI00210A88C9|nr:helix-hairpin-helix domain-containing protein [Streptomyces sp. ODS05-4]
MTARTRTARSAAHRSGVRGRATSGPGRAGGSDGRTRRGSGHGGLRGRVGRRAAADTALAAARRRADRLFASPPDPRRPPPDREAPAPALPGDPPTPAQILAEAARAEAASVEAALTERTFTEAVRAEARSAEAGAATGDAVLDRAGTTGSASAVSSRKSPGRRERWRLAVRDRLPLWVQTRCGMEPRALAALAVVLAVAAALAGRHFWTGRPEPVRAPDVIREATPPRPRATVGAGPTAGPLPVVVIDVGGEVRHPGVLRLPAGSRVADALRAAGGVTPGTDLGGLNRARVLMDGEQVVVGAAAQAAGASVPGLAQGPQAAAGGPGAAAGPVSLSTATVEQLDTLPGVGPVLARKIVDHRTRSGGFRSVEQLREVSGIGERRFAELQPLVRP